MWHFGQSFIKLIIAPSNSAVRLRSGLCWVVVASGEMNDIGLSRGVMFICRVVVSVVLSLYVLVVRLVKVYERSVCTKSMCFSQRDNSIVAVESAMKQVQTSHSVSLTVTVFLDASIW